jgi:hypothetical protein
MLKKFLAASLVLFCIGISANEETTKLVEIRISDHSEVYELNKLRLTIVDAGADFAKALVTDDDISLLRNTGYHVEILIEDYKGYKDTIFQRGFYHTYSQVYSVLDSFATYYPNICRLDTIGFSVQGRAIWAMRVTDNPTNEENEPEIRLAGNIHGDEHIGTEITLYFLRHILTNYATSPQVQNLIDNNEIWILPTSNPDGKVANTRRNANNVDLNRDYGFFWDGWGNSPGPSSQVENQLMMQHLEENHIGLEYNYHSVAQYVNYPWDYHMADPPDSQHIIVLSEIYADSANLTAINGYEWYQALGSLQDYSIGTSGTLAWTIETLEPSASSAIDQICYDNRDALMDICARAAWGINGVVKDSLSGSGLYARIEFINPDRVDIFTDPLLGDFHKMIEQGVYDIKVNANGYAPKTIDNVSVPASGNVSVGDVLLVPDSTFLYAFRVVLCRYVEHAEQGNKTQPRFALGVPDNQFFSLGQNGFIVVDIGSNTPIHNSPGFDFTVYEGNDNTDEGYEVFVNNDWFGTWQSCGSATGTADFDLSTAGLSVARYVKVVDDGSSSSGQYAGFDLDAIQVTPPANLPNLYVSSYQILDGNGILEPGETADLVASLCNAGMATASNISTVLRTNDMYLVINDSSAVYGNILPDSTVTNNSDPFNVTALPSAPYGYEADLQLIVTGTGYLDTIDLAITVGVPVPTDTGYYYVYYSGGPHTYSPTFDWVAIDSTQSQYPGVSLNLGDDQVAQATLPFSFQYYGTNYTQITISSNGWVCMGYESSSSVTNYGIPNAGGPAAMIAGIWDDLDPGNAGQPSDIYYYYDAANHRFIIEYFQVEHYPSGAHETFEIILYDPVYYPTPTGDGDIVVQYLVSLQQADNTLGIENGSETVGIQYYLDGAYHSLAEPVTDSFALKYTTYPPDYVGIEEYGKVTHLPTQTVLAQVVPSPFIKQLRIDYALAVSDYGTARLLVYDATGRLVRDLSRQLSFTGHQSSVIWDSRDDVGRRVPAGVYFVKLTTDDYQNVQKTVLLK